jgi:hypothetical protein
MVSVPPSSYRNCLNLSLVRFIRECQRTSSNVTTDLGRVERWCRRLDRLDNGSLSEPIILNESMISQWLRDHRAEYNSATETIKACMGNFRLHRRHRKLVWDIYTR